MGVCFLAGREPCQHSHRAYDCQASPEHLLQIHIVFLPTLPGLSACPCSLSLINGMSVITDICLLLEGLGCAGKGRPHQSLPEADVLIHRPLASLWNPSGKALPGTLMPVECTHR